MGLLIAGYLFRGELAWLKKLSYLIIALSIIMSAFEQYESREGFRPLPFVKSTLLAITTVVRSLLLIIAILPIIVFELISGPAALLGAALFTISVPIYALESWAKIDVVPVDLSRETTTTYLVILGALACWGVLLLRHYVFAKYQLMDKLYTKLAEGFAKIR